MRVLVVALGNMLPSYIPVYLENTQWDNFKYEKRYIHESCMRIVICIEKMCNTTSLVNLTRENKFLTSTVFD